MKCYLLIATSLDLIDTCNAVPAWFVPPVLPPAGTAREILQIVNIGGVLGRHENAKETLIAEKSLDVLAKLPKSMRWYQAMHLSMKP